MTPELIVLVQLVVVLAMQLHNMLKLSMPSRCHLIFR